jgi:hypothetical protein
MAFASQPSAVFAFASCGVMSSPSGFWVVPAASMNAQPVKFPHRLCGVHVLGASRLVNGEWVVSERFGLLAYIRNFGFADAAAVAQNDFAAVGEAFVTIDRCSFFLFDSEK